MAKKNTKKTTVSDDKTTKKTKKVTDIVAKNKNIKNTKKSPKPQNDFMVPLDTDDSIKDEKISKSKDDTKNPSDNLLPSEKESIVAQNNKLKNDQDAKSENIKEKDIEKNIENVNDKDKNIKDEKAKQESSKNKQPDENRNVGTLAPVEEDQEQTPKTSKSVSDIKKTAPAESEEVVVKNDPPADTDDTKEKTPASDKKTTGSLESVDDDDISTKTIDEKPVSISHEPHTSSEDENDAEKDESKKTQTEKKSEKADDNDFFISNISSSEKKSEDENHDDKEKSDKSEDESAEGAEQTSKDDKKDQKEEGKTEKDKKPAEDNKSKQTKGKKKHFWDFLTKSYGGGDTEFIIQNLALFLTSGINILTSLEAMKSETKNKNLREKISDLKDLIEDGTPLWRALKDLEIVSENTVALIKIGEDSGKLTENLNVIANQQQKDRSFRSKVLSAMLYPVVVLSMTIIVALGIAWFILPRLATVFSTMKMDLPFITQAVIWLGKFLAEWGLIAVPATLIIIALIAYYVFIHPKTKYIGQAILFKIPGIKDVLLQVEITRFGFILGTLLDAGIPIGTALGSLKESTTTFIYKDIYASLTKGIEEGNSFQKCFHAYKNIDKYIPSPVQQMIISAEQSGTLGITLKKVGEMYEEKTDFSTKNLATIIEPILLFIVWGGVLTVALAVIIPIYGLVGGMNQASKQTQPSSQSAPVEDIDTTQETIADIDEDIQDQEDVTEEPVEDPEVEIKKVKILTTETGYLNVRSEPSTAGDIVQQVRPDDEFEYEEVQNNWYKIKVSPTVTGWVSGDYVEIVQ